MPRIIVTTAATQPREGAVLLDELVQSVHLSTGHAAAQLVERLAWAISDAEEVERGTHEPSRPALPRSPKHRTREHRHDAARAIAA
ncbi:MAG TPA: hypothetical protein VHY83_05540 [Solirubrobacteraceae bacterium]|jgi:hypothetical protein|nr:hypothetical protein [Solirubrobacteraceae bacterium]